MTVVCPRCGLEMPWEPQGKQVVVRCPNREMTSWTMRGDPLEMRHQMAVTMYATTDRKRCWIESYWVDGPDRLPKWRCGAEFAVQAVKDL